MASKHLLSGTSILLGVNTLSAQAPAALHTANTGDADVTGVVDLLEHNALLALVGFVVLMAILFICHLSKACAGLNRAQKNARNLLILVVGLSSFCGSCSVAQQARAVQYRAAEMAEYPYCHSPYQHGNYANIPFNNGYSKGHGPVYCRHCGQKIPDRNY